MRKLSRKQVFLAAPFVVTTALASGCAEPTVYTNPGRPEMPPPDDSGMPAVATASASAVVAAPSASAPVVATAAPLDLPPAPVGDGGHLMKQPDGTCLYIYPPPNMECPPHTFCNPGPPREPLKVSCDSAPKKPLSSH